MTKNILSVIAIASVSLLASCTKVINVDLNSASPKLVVEGAVTNQPGPYKVTLAQSINMDQLNKPAVVGGALVVITDQTADVSDTLKEQATGSYYTSKIQGTPGHTYQLTVVHNNNNYVSVSTMPQPVPFDSLYAQDFTAFGQTAKNLVPVYTDPAGVANFYRFVEYVNGRKMTNLDARDDERNDGLTSVRPFFNNPEDVVKGDSVTIEMQSIDQGLYDFFRTFGESTGDGGRGIPANPVNNITGGALGYFGAYTVQRKSIIIP